MPAQSGVNIQILCGVEMAPWEGVSCPQNFQGLVLAVLGPSSPLVRMIVLTLGELCPSPTLAPDTALGLVSSKVGPTGGSGGHLQSLGPKVSAYSIPFLSFGWKPRAGSHVGYHYSQPRKSRH